MLKLSVRAARTLCVTGALLCLLTVAHGRQTGAHCAMQYRPDARLDTSQVIDVRGCAR